MAPRSSASPLRALLLALALAASACSQAVQSTAPLTPSVPLERSPSHGASFDFCPVPPADVTFPLRDAAWLSFFSANEYSHAAVIGPMLATLGFANPNHPGDATWDTCTTDLRRLREAEAAHKEELSSALGKPALRGIARSLVPDGADWGSCARPFLADEALRVDAFPAATFQEHLVREARPGAFLQFFSAGSIAKDGKSFHDASTQVLFARHREQPVAVLAFRGTETSQRADLIADLKVWKTELAGHGWPASWGNAHTGFVEAFEAVEPLILKKAAELEGSGVKIWLTGHSLGGALATLGAARLMRAREEGMKIEIGGVITFGSPRVGDDAFAATFREAAARAGARVLRVRNGDDAVTRIPGKSLGFAHVGELAHLTEGALAIAPDPEPAYGGSSFADHGKSGWDEAGAPTSGYYRRLFELLEAKKYPELERCDAPLPAPAKGQ